MSDLFDLRYGHSLELNALEQSTSDDAVNFVGRAARQNGVTARVRAVSGEVPAAAGTITVALGGQGGAGVAFLQPFPYYCGRDVMILTPKLPMSEQEKLWWVACISANRFRYGFGRQANRSLASLTLPNKEEIPSWVNETNVDQFEGASKALDTTNHVLPPLETWKTFKYSDLFDIKKGQRLTKAEMAAGDTPFVAAIDKNNGYRQFVTALPNHSANTITVNYNGSVAEAFYQPEPFRASDDVNVLYPKFELNRYSALFICALIRQEKFRFNYGRKWHVERMVDTLIRLPVTKMMQPDWKLITEYMRSLPYSSSV
ncbi:restriction endonuclease subunit S [Agrobacterium tumefaciens]|uniref:restriction endonuclease subunit S n=1 Tax=Agrobacterium tumefaciens TaxID=358 RepID=UPI003B9EF055